MKTAAPQKPRSGSLILTVLSFSLLALALTVSSPAFASDAASSSHDAKTAFETLKSMHGTWAGTVAAEGEDVRETKVTYRTTANGHSVIQTFAPGSPYEMFSVYHMDGDELLMTHYCAIGNAPKMKFEATGEKGQLKFAFNGGANFDPTKDAHAHEGMTQVIDENTYRSNSVGWSNGAPGQKRQFDMKRVSETVE